MFHRRTPGGCRRPAPTIPAAVPSVIEPLESRVLLSSNWFVSTTGSDANPGTLSAPFATIQHAANLAQAGDTVLIRGGTYHETVSPANSGAPGAPITFQPYNNESVEIDGADPITGWNSGPAYAAPMPWDLGEGNNQVFVDGKMMVEARWPNTSFDVSHPKLASAVGATVSGSSTTVYDPWLTQPRGFWTGGIIHFTPGQRWVAYTATITDSGPGYVTFNWTAPSASEMPGQGTQYYLMGKLNALDAPGEWYRDPTSGLLYLWVPTGDAPTNHIIEAKHRVYAFDLSGDSYVTIKGLSIFAATINTDGKSNNVVLDHLNAQYLSQFVMQASGWTSPANGGIVLDGNNDLLENSEIAYSAGDGVYVNGAGVRVTNNDIHDVNYNAGDSAGIRLWGPYATLDHNTVYNAGRDGLKLAGWRVQVTYNTIHDVMLQTTDGGGAYALRSDGTGSRIAYNRIYNVNAGGFGAVGIYLDDDSRNWTVDHNVTYNDTIGLKLNYSSLNEHVYNNTFGAVQFSVAKNWGASDWTGTVFKNNIFTRPFLQIGTGATLQNNINPNTNPMFANPLSGDFSLQAGSPAVDAGAVIPRIAESYVGAMPDIGALERGLTPFVSGARLVAIPMLPPLPPLSAASPPPAPPPAVGPDATSVIQTPNYDSARGIGASYGGIGYCDNGDWAEYSGVNFGNGVSSVQLSVAVTAPYAGQQIQLRVDGLNGPILGTLVTQATSSWSDFAAQSTAVANVTGVHDLYLVFVGGYAVGNVKWVKFS